MRVFLARELRVIVGLVALGLALSLVAFALVSSDVSGIGGGRGQNSPASDEAARQGLPRLRWKLTGQYRAEVSGVGLTVISFSVNPGGVTVLYALDAGDGERAEPVQVTLMDGNGKAYPIRSNSVTGVELGVTMAVAETGAYDGSLGVLTLEVRGAKVAGPDGSERKIDGTWKAAFVENVDGAPVDYSENGKIAPEVMRAGDLTLSKAGGPGLGYIKLMIDRAGRQSALYGYLADDGVHGLTEQEFRALLMRDFGSGDDLPVSPDFPAPAPRP